MESARKKLQWEVWAEKLGVSHKEALKLGESFSENESGVILRERREVSPDLLIPLFPYQKEFLAWAMKQEKSRIKGGILADETGMGKTIQAIPLILTSRSLNSRTHSMVLRNRKKRIVSRFSHLPQVKATLVVGPTTTLAHWQNEISQYTKEGSVKVMVYHSPRRRVTINELSEYDIVLTTHNTVQSEHRNPCEFCRQPFYPDEIVHQTCQSGDIKIQYQSNLENLAMMTSVKQGCANGKEGSKDKNKRKAIDSSEYLSPMIYAVKWNRIIIDESQCKADGTINPRAILKLQSNHKCDLTSNPLENTNLINFLQVEPFSYRYCQECNCKKLDSSYNVGCKCGHWLYGHFSWWSKYVMTFPCARTYQKRIMILKHKVLDPIFLRRTKHERKTDLAFPPKTVFVRRDALTAREEAFYQSRKPINFISRRAISEHRTLIRKLRQAVDHPYLVVYEQNKDDPSPTGYVCDGCHIALEHIKSCKHPCTGYINQDNRTDDGCPVCERNISIVQKVKKALRINRASILDQTDLRKLQTSTKIDALTEEIVLMTMNDASAKGVVFSHFPEFLDLIGFFLEKSGIKCVILDNNMMLNNGKELLEIFANDADCKVILMNIKAGGVAPDLTAASHVFLMDPWWNPIAEQQAQSSIYRLDQHKPIKVVKFIMENTIDEHILDLQWKKAPDFEGAMNHFMIAPDSIFADDVCRLIS